MGRRAPIKSEALAWSPPSHPASAPTRVQTYVGAQAVGRSDLVDVIGMDMAIGAAGSGLALTPTHGPAVHHAGGRWASLIPLTARERIAVVRHNSAESRREQGGDAGRHGPDPAHKVPCPLPCPPLAAYPRRRRNHQAPSRRPPRQPCWWWVSQDSRFWGDKTGVMCPREWIETRSDATAGGSRGAIRGQAVAHLPLGQPCPQTHLPWRRPRSLRSCPGPAARGSDWATSWRPQRPWAAPPLGLAPSARQRWPCLPPALAWAAPREHFGVGGPPRVQGLPQLEPEPPAPVRLSCPHLGGEWRDPAPLSAPSARRGGSRCFTGAALRPGTGKRPHGITQLATPTLCRFLLRLLICHTLLPAGPWPPGPKGQGREAAAAPVTRQVAKTNSTRQKITRGPE